MTLSRASREQMFRVWIVRLCLDQWSPMQWHDVPQIATALEPAEPNCLTYEETVAMVEGFNLQMLATQSSLWAVAVPVTVRFEGEPDPGGIVRGNQLAPLEITNEATGNRQESTQRLASSK